MGQARGVDAFTHVVGLLGLVFVIALALLLERASELIMARGRARFSGLAALAAFNAGLLVYANWLALWEVHNLTNWTLVTVTLLFLFALSIFFVCALALPSIRHDGPLDMEDFYWRQHRVFYAAWLASDLLAVACNLSLSAGMSAQNVWRENVTNLLSAGVVALALIAPMRWAQWAAGLVLTANEVGYLLAFDSDLG